MPIPIHRLTQQQYSDEVFRRLGKGVRHAALVYSEYYKKGRVKGDGPAFGNAQRLLRQILAATNFDLPPP